MIFITADVLNSARFDSISFCEKFGFLWASEMVNEAQNPLAKMEVLLVCG